MQVVQDELVVTIIFNLQIFSGLYPYKKRKENVVLLVLRGFFCLNNEGLSPNPDHKAVTSIY